jgi:hypothetical protein
MKAAMVSAAIGGTLAAAEGLLLVLLGGLAGLAENREGEAARSDGYMVLALAAIVLTAAFAARGRPFLLAAASAVSAAAGFLVDNPLWIFAAVFLIAAAVLAVISRRDALRFANRGAKPS